MAGTRAIEATPITSLSPAREDHSFFGTPSVIELTNPHGHASIADTFSKGFQTRIRLFQPGTQLMVDGGLWPKRLCCCRMVPATPPEKSGGQTSGAYSNPWN